MTNSVVGYRKKSFRGVFNPNPQPNRIVFNCNVLLCAKYCEYRAALNII